MKASIAEKPEIPKKPKQSQPDQPSVSQPNGKQNPIEPSSQTLKRSLDDISDERDPKKAKVGGPEAKSDQVLVVDDESGAGAILIDDD